MTLRTHSHWKSECNSKHCHSCLPLAKVKCSSGFTKHLCDTNIILSFTFALCEQTQKAHSDKVAVTSITMLPSFNITRQCRPGPPILIILDLLIMPGQSQPSEGSSFLIGPSTSPACLVLLEITAPSRAAGVGHFLLLGRESGHLPYWLAMGGRKRRLPTWPEGEVKGSPTYLAGGCESGGSQSMVEWPLWTEWQMSMKTLPSLVLLTWSVTIGYSFNFPVTWE